MVAESMSDTCVLKCKDIELLEFKFHNDVFGTPFVEVTDVNDDYAHLMPWGLVPDGDSLYNWLSNRALPHNRRFAEELCRSMGLSIDDVAGIYSVSLGLSLNDSYWTPKREDARTFAEVNLYENGFSSVLAAIAYTGIMPRDGSQRGFTPELTTDGSLHKAWRIGESDERILYKGANGWYPGEPMSELIASYIAHSINLCSVPYGLDIWQDELCSTCVCFCNQDFSYTPFAVASGFSDLGAALAFCSRLGEETFEELRDMLIFDCLIFNTDRHFTNFGLMRDVSSGKAIGLAPIFDNGRGLLPNLPTEMLDDCQSEIASHGPAFGGRTFDELATRVMGSQQLAWLSKIETLDFAELIGAFEGTELEADVSARCNGVIDIVKEQAKRLLKIKPSEHNAMLPKLKEAWMVKKDKSEGVNHCPAERIEALTRLSIIQR